MNTIFKKNLTIDQLPNINGYHPVEILYPENLSSQYAFALYRNKNIDAFAKILVSAFKDSAYSDLLNEIKVNQLINTINKNDILIPDYLGFYTKNGILILLTRHIKSMNFDNLSIDSQCSIYAKTVLSLNRFNAEHKKVLKNNSKLRVRKATHYLLATLFISGKLFIINPKLIQNCFQIIKLAWLGFILLSKNSNLVFTHGDLVTNILVTSPNKKAYLTDFQTACLTNQDYEISSLLTSLWPSKKLFNIVSIKLGSNNVNPLIGLYCSTFATLDHTWKIEDYQKYITYLNNN